MSATWPLVVLVLFSVAAYLGWAAWERRHTRRAAALAADMAALGEDAVPPSLHPVIDPDVCIGSGACVRACPEKEILGIVNGQARLINPLACVGHGACMAACPVSAIRLVFGTASRGVELPAIGPDFQTDRPGVYVIGELAGMGLIRNAVEQGRQVAATIAGGPRRASGGLLDAVVVGAGPAGITATLALADAGARVMLLEQAQLGGTVRHYPRRKVVMTGAIDLPGYGRVRRRTMTKEELASLWDDVHATARFPLETGIGVDSLRPDGSDVWVVGGEGREWRAANVVLALGRRGAPRRLGVPGEDLPHVHYRLLEPEPFAGQHVLVVGGGNAAAECALALVDFGRCASVALSYRRAQLARLRAQVRERVEAAIAGGRLEALLETEVVTIGKTEVSLRHADGRQLRRPTDALIVQVGGTSPGALLSRLGIATVTKHGEA